MTVAREPAAAPLRALAPMLRDEPALGQVFGRRTVAVAVPEAARAVTLAGLASLSERRPMVVVVPNSSTAERLAQDLAQFIDPAEVELFGAWETLPFERVSPSIETMGQRMRVLWRLRDPERWPKFIVTSARALAQRLGPHVEQTDPVVVRPGDRLDPAELVARLVAMGYRREDLAEHRGEVAVRGSIVDVFGSTDEHPVRIDLWGDEVDRLTQYSVTDQRSTDALSEAVLFPARELLPTDEVRARAEALMATEPWGREHWDKLANGLTFDGMESWLPWLAPDERTLLDIVDPLGDRAQVIMVEPRRMRDRAAEIGAEEDDLARTLATTWGAADRTFPRLHLPFDTLLAGRDLPVWSMVNAPDSPDMAAVAATPWAPVVGDGEALVRRIQGLLSEGYRVIVAAEGVGSADRLAALLRDRGVDLPVLADASEMKRGGAVVVAPFNAGFVLSSVKLAIICEADLTGRKRAHRRPRPRKRDAVGFFEDLKPGDFVVHFQHGVGRYGGMVTRAIGGVERDYLLLEYKGGDKLYVPSDQIDAVRHYVGGDQPSLHRLGGSDFAKAKGRVRAAVREIAQELVVLYQTRVNSAGHAFAPDTPWQSEMEDAFQYTETPDQRTAIADVKADMESEHPMDRLVCGDVGFGKTEVAVRAAFKAVQDGKQVAVLVPTTLLAQQHFQTFSDRFAGFPVRVEVLSRFLTNAQARTVAAGVRAGEVDVLIGTHRMLSEDIDFKDLGLLVIDEEQRFGVTHKESIKKLKTNVDVLTLTATPIPRTLEMSLTGIRDLTLLNTPPADRQPILTYVGEYDDRAVAESLRRELLREGQVFFVHNRVADIEAKAAELRELVPEARITVAHGQMDEGSLESVVMDFWEGRADVLVCTTIIESGIDMPTVNTLVVERADLLGLGQLHQLRGRVGRSGQRAYAYLFHPRDVALSEDAYERLRTIGEATELGSGFKIAMRDLEIRGAGNLLSESQSGHIAAVGYDLYCQMVNEAVAEMKGEPVREPAEVKLDVPTDAHLPADYVTKEELRLEAYRRLAAVTEHAEVDDIRAEWIDRFGPVPEMAENLLAVAHLRAECFRTGIRDVQITSAGARLSPLKLRTSEEIRLKRLAKQSLYKEDLGQLVIPIPRGQDPARFLVGLLGELISTAVAGSGVIEMRSMRLEQPGAIAGSEVGPLLAHDGVPPRPGIGEVLVTVHACGVCRTDLQICEGDLPARHLPIVPGHQVVGRITEVGPGVSTDRLGQEVGLAWIAGTCGTCRFCVTGRENLCTTARFTGWDRDGGFAELVVADDRFAFTLPPGLDPVATAPLLCGGAIGLRALRVSGIEPGGRLGLFGFGASATCAIQIAVHRGCEVYVATRSAAEQRRAMDLGARWAGGYDEPVPVPLEAAVTFAPAGEVVIAALRSLDRGGTVAVNAIHLDRVPEFSYDDLWWERSIRSVANVTRADVIELIELAARIPIVTQVESFRLDEANVALRSLAAGTVSGAAVLTTPECPQGPR